MPTTTTGSTIEAYFKFEDSFNGTASGEPLIFGANQSVESYELDNSLTNIGRLGKYTLNTAVNGVIDGSFSVTFHPTTGNVNWLSIFDKSPESQDNDNDTFYDMTTVQSFELHVQRLESGTNRVRVAKGCIPQNLTVTTTTDEPVEVTIEGVYTDEIIRESTSESAPSVSGRVFNFNDTNLVWGGTEKFDISQEASIEIEYGTSLIQALGSRTASDFALGQVTGTASVTHAVQNDELYGLEQVYGGDAGFTEPQTGQEIEPFEIQFFYNSGNNFITFGGNLVNESYSESGLTPDSDLVTADLAGTVVDWFVEIDTGGND